MSISHSPLLFYKSPYPYPIRPKLIKVVSMKSQSILPTYGCYLFSGISPQKRFSYFHHINISINRFTCNGFHINLLAFKRTRNGISKPTQLKNINGKITLSAASSLASLNILAESETTWVKESEENSLIKTRALRLGIKCFRVDISLRPTYLASGSEPASAVVSVAVFVAVTDKGRDKSYYRRHVGILGQKDTGGYHVFCCHFMKQVFVTKGNKMVAICPGPSTVAPNSEVKVNASSTMRQPSTQVVTEEMRELGRDRLSHAG